MGSPCTAFDLTPYTAFTFLNAAILSGPREARTVAAERATRYTSSELIPSNDSTPAHTRATAARDSFAYLQSTAASRAKRKRSSLAANWLNRSKVVANQ